MSSLSNFRSTVALSLLLCFCFTPCLQAQAESAGASDKGYLFMGPREEIKSRQIKKDRFIRAFFSKGVVITENPDSPWHNAACFAHGSVITDLEGTILKEVVIYETTDADGDLTWSVL